MNKIVETQIRSVIERFVLIIVLAYIAGALAGILITALVNFGSTVGSFAAAIFTNLIVSIFIAYWGIKHLLLPLLGMGK